MKFLLAIMFAFSVMTNTPAICSHASGAADGHSEMSQHAMSDDADLHAHHDAMHNNAENEDYGDQDSAGSGCGDKCKGGAGCDGCVTAASAIVADNDFAWMIMTSSQKTHTEAKSTIGRITLDPPPPRRA